MHYSKSVLTIILLTIASGVFAQIQEIVGDNIQEALYIKNGGTSGITVYESIGDGIVIDRAGFKAGYFTTSTTSTSPGIVVGQLNPSEDYHYHDIQLSGSRIIGSTKDVLIDIDSDMFNTSEDPNFFGIIHGDRDNPVFLVSQDGSVEADGNLSAKRITAQNTNDSQPDFITGGINGIISSSTASGSSNLNIRSNKDIFIQTGRVGNSSKFSIIDNGGENIFSVSNNGEVHVGNSLTHGSDRNIKDNIENINYKTILEKISNLPVYSWNYKSNNISHIGPMAQDFYAEFNLGNNDKTISIVDADGISMAAIKGLYELMQEELATKSTEITELQERLAALEDE